MGSIFVVREMFSCSQASPRELERPSIRIDIFTSSRVIMKTLSRFFALAALARIGYAFNLYPPVDPNKLAAAYNISLDCLSAL